MAVLAGIIKNVLVIIIMASFLEMLLPEGRLKPFVRFAIGLFILIAVLNPVLNTMFKGQEFKVELWDYSLDKCETEEIARNGNDLNGKIMGQGDAIMKEKLQGQISAIAVLVPGVEDVSTETVISPEGSLEKVHLVINQEGPTPEENGDNVGVFADQQGKYDNREKKAIQKKIKSILSNLYGMKEADIEIEFKGG